MYFNLTPPPSLRIRLGHCRFILVASLHLGRFHICVKRELREEMRELREHIFYFVRGEEKERGRERYLCVCACIIKSCEMLLDKMGIL